MTTGQRIALKRKELGLSQEALGEKLGVSRQSIYKWESDSALPEIEKLVTLSRLFGVSVGWLLCVEEDSGGPELTEDQLRMVEEIAARCAPRPRLSPERMAAVKMAVAVAAVCLCIVLFGFYRRLEDLGRSYSYLQSSIYQVQNGVDNQINGISGRVEELLRTQNAVTADYGTNLIDVDPSASSASFRVYAVPKTYVEGMTAEFYEANGGASWVVDAEETAGRRFEANVTCGLSENIALAVTFRYPDETRQTQVLEVYEGLYGQTFPRMSLRTEFSHKPVQDGALALTEKDLLRLDWVDETTADISTVPVAELESLRVGLFKNRKLVDWAVFSTLPGVVEEETTVLTAEQWKALDGLRQNDGGGSHGFQLLNLCFPAQEVPLEGGDQLHVAMVLRDVYGRTAVRTGSGFGLDEGWSELAVLDADAPDACPGGWMLEDGSSICDVRP